MAHFSLFFIIFNFMSQSSDKIAAVAELADALGLGPNARKGLRVRVSPAA